MQNSCGYICVTVIADSTEPFICIEIGLGLFNKDWLVGESLVLDNGKNDIQTEEEVARTNK